MAKAETFCIKFLVKNISNEVSYLEIQFCAERVPSLARLAGQAEERMDKSYTTFRSRTFSALPRRIGGAESVPS